MRDAHAVRLDDAPSEQSPEKELMRAVLVRAVHDYCGQGRMRRNDPHDTQQDAAKWLFSNSTEFMSYLSICEYLNAPAEKIRNEIQRLGYKVHAGRKKAAGLSQITTAAARQKRKPRIRQARRYLRLVERGRKNAPAPA